MNLMLGAFIKWPEAKDNSRQGSKQRTGNREERWEQLWHIPGGSHIQKVERPALLLVKRLGEVHNFLPRSVKREKSLPCLYPL